MPAIPYLTGNESATAARMNLIFAELDRKMSLMLRQKSFALSLTINQSTLTLTGKAFFFTAGVCVYAQRFPGAILTAPNTVRPYNASQFDAAATTAVVTAVDEDNRIMTVTNFLSAAYQGIPVNGNASLFDHSLRTHTRLGTGTGPLTGQLGVRYFLRETGIGVPEKFYDYAAAEIVLEGQTAVNLPREWDKYCFFRIHNLNHVPATVTFGEDHTVTLAPLGCQTVRRTRTVTNGAATFSNYRNGYRYFWPFEGNDPRFFWFHPTSWTGTENVRSSSEPNVSNSMVANNLINPAMVYDWVARFLDVNQAAHWWRNPHEVAPLSAASQALFGDPGNPATLLGDLLHHRGQFTFTHGFGANQVTTTREFRSYATLATDLAGTSMTVIETADGNLRLMAAVPGVNPVIIASESNFLKRGESIPGVIELFQTAGYPIEKAVLDNGLVTTQLPPDTNIALATTAPYSVIGVAATLRENVRAYGQFPNTVAVTGTPYKSFANISGGARRVVTAIHKVTVEDLRSLKFWGRNGAATQDTDVVTFEGIQLRLTTGGLVLLYDEVYAEDANRTYSNVGFTNFTFEDARIIPPQGTRYRRIIRFRGHGWPWGDVIGSAKSRSDMGAKFITNTPYEHEIIGPDGKDFDVHGIQAVPDGQSPLRLIKPAELNLFTRHGRFWMLPDRQCVRLSIDCYNDMAALVNSLEGARPLSHTALKWIVNNVEIGLDYIEDFGSLWPNWIASSSSYVSSPVPADAFDWNYTLPPNGRLETLARQLNIPIRGFADMDPRMEEFSQVTPQVQRIESRGRSVFSNFQVVGGPGDHSVTATVRTTLEEPVLGTVYNGPPGRIGASAEGLRNQPSSDWTNVSFPNLSAFRPVRWLKVQDVQTYLQGIGFELNLVRYGRPLQLKVLELNTGGSLDPVSRTENVRHDFNIGGNRGLTTQNLPDIHSETEFSEENGPFTAFALILRRALLFIPAPTPEDARWIDKKQVNFVRRGSRREANQPDYMLALASGANGQLEVTFSESFGWHSHLRGGLTLTFEPIPFVRALDLYDCVGIWKPTGEDNEALIAFNDVEESAVLMQVWGTGAKTKLTLWPEHQWSLEKDWFAQSLENYVNGYVPPGGGFQENGISVEAFRTPVVSIPAGWARTTLTLEAGTHIVRAPAPDTRAALTLDENVVGSIDL